MNTFSDLGLSQSILKVLPELGLENPTNIQREAIPVLLEKDRDFIGLAQTGTGKTAAFGLPILEAIAPEIPYPQALILAPTRELGQQIGQQLKAFSKYMPAIHTEVVYGGASIINQIKALKKPTHVVIATPGRLIDLIKRKAVNIEAVNFVVLDEADEMLSMGFKEELDQILSHTPEDKSTWLFSATMPKEIRHIVKHYMHDPVEVKVGSGNEVNKNIEHQYTVVKRSDKVEALKRFLDMHADMQGIVFCRTKIETQNLAAELVKQQYAVDALHGDLNQNQRDQVMRRFKAHTLKLIIATDVAARGIDVNNLTHVIHYDMPENSASYTHRSGRTARAGKKGISLALISKGDIRKIRLFEKQLSINFQQDQVPSVSEITQKRMTAWANRIIETEEIPNISKAVSEEVFEILSQLDKNELISRLMAWELKQLGGFGDSGKDLNDHGGGEREKSSRQRPKDSNRFFINVGSVDDMNKSGLLRFICDQTGLSKENIGDIDLQQRHSFFEVEKSHAHKISDSFNGLSMDGRDIRVNRDDVKRKDKGDKKFKSDKKRKRKKSKSFS